MIATFTKREVQNCIRTFSKEVAVEAVVAGFREAETEFVIYEVTHYDETYHHNSSLGLFSTRQRAERFIQRAKNNDDCHANEYKIRERKIDDADKC